MKSNTFSSFKENISLPLQLTSIWKGNYDVCNLNLKSHKLISTGYMHILQAQLSVC